MSQVENFESEEKKYWCLVIGKQIAQNHFFLIVVFSIFYFVKKH